ncbi:MAG: EAL domain-containing protein [Pseudomonadota bacterium]
MGAQAVRLSNIDIDNALDNRDFEVLFQPIFDLGNGALARMETFVRWRHPKLGVLPPGAFISFFETQGRMGELTRYVLEEALDHYIRWRGNCAPGFSINLATTDLSDDDFPAFVTALLRDRDFPADAVTFECPMPSLESDAEDIRAQLARLKETGIRLAIEVRGRANDFLRDVSPFPFEEIKTGGAAILRFARTVRGPGLSAISELLDIANGAGASITAVGVEDQASLSALRGLGFSAAQGNHLGKVGGLNDFRPAQVNSVRELLELEALSNAQLSALFRTERPQLDDSTQEDNQDDTTNKKPGVTGKPEPKPKRRSTKTRSTKTAEASNASQSQSDAQDQPDDSAETDADAAPTNVVERARRKAALLARKKGKDALRAELAARRKKLGLAEPISTLEEPVSAARDLQDQLLDAFPDDEKGGNAPDGSSTAKDALPDDAPVAEEETDDQEHTLAEDVAIAAETAPIADTLDPEAPNQEEEPAPAFDGEATEDNSGETPTGEIDIRDTHNSDPEETTLTIVTLDDILPTEEPASAVTDGKPAIRKQEPTPSEHKEDISQDVVATDETLPEEGSDNLVFVPAAKMTATPTEAAGSAARADTMIRTQKTPVEAYFLETIKVFTEIADAPQQPREQIAIDAALPDTDNLVIISMDDEPPKSTAPAQASGLVPSAPEHREPEQNQDVRVPTTQDDVQTPLFQPEHAAQTTRPVPEAPALGTLDLDRDEIADDPVTNIGIDDARENELAHLSASRAVTGKNPAKRRRRKNLLLRRYRLWPDHFWPRSWRRAWDRRADNREFVRRARLAAARLGSVEDDDDGEVL